MTLTHRKLQKLLQLAYSAEKAAAFAYQGHAASLKDPQEKACVRQIEIDEWEHRDNVLGIMQHYDIRPSRWLECKYHVIGKIISASCHVLGHFMPAYFAARLESGNVNEYFTMMCWFHESGISAHDAELYEMGVKEKEHERDLLAMCVDSRLLPIFAMLFRYGPQRCLNRVDLEELLPVEDAEQYCGDV